MMIEETAITSADPVDITAIRIRNSIANSPVCGVFQDLDTGMESIEFRIMISGICRIWELNDPIGGVISVLDPIGELSCLTSHWLEINKQI